MGERLDRRNYMADENKAQTRACKVCGMAYDALSLSNPRFSMCSGCARKVEADLLYKDVKILVDDLELAQQFVSNNAGTMEFPITADMYSLYSALLERAKLLYIDDDIIQGLRELRNGQGDDVFALNHDARMLFNHIESEYLMHRIETLRATNEKLQRDVGSIKRVM